MSRTSNLGLDNRWTRTPFPEVTFENSPQEVELVIKNEQV